MSASSDTKSWNKCLFWLYEKPFKLDEYTKYPMNVHKRCRSSEYEEMESWMSEQTRQRALMHMNAISNAKLFTKHQFDMRMIYTSLWKSEWNVLLSDSLPFESVNWKWIEQKFCQYQLSPSWLFYEMDLNGTEWEQHTVFVSFYTDTANAIFYSSSTKKHQSITIVRTVWHTKKKKNLFHWQLWRKSERDYR